MIISCASPFPELFFAKINPKGLPFALEMTFRKRLDPLRCHRAAVLGLAVVRDTRHGLGIMESKIRKSRSPVWIFGRLPVRVNTTNWWRGTRFWAARYEVILIFSQMNLKRYRYWKISLRESPFFLDPVNLLRHIDSLIANLNDCQVGGILAWSAWIIPAHHYSSRGFSSDSFSAGNWLHLL